MNDSKDALKPIQIDVECQEFRILATQLDKKKHYDQVWRFDNSSFWNI